MEKIQFTHDEKYLDIISNLIEFYDIKQSMRCNNTGIGKLCNTTIHASFSVIMNFVYDLGKLKINVNFIVESLPHTNYVKK